MAFYYVKSGGTATGDAGRAGTARTGTFAAMGVAAYYDNISDALTVPTTSPAGGDEFRVSNLHSHSYGGVNTSFTFPVDPGIFIVSVSDTNADQSLVGASEQAGGTADFVNLGGVAAYHGLDFTIGDEWQTGTNAIVNLQDASVTFTNTGDRFTLLAGDGSVFNLINTDIIYPNGATDSVIVSRGGGRFSMVGGTIVATVNDIDAIISSDAANGGWTISLEGVSIPTLQLGVQGVGATASDDMFDFRMDKCDVSATFTPADEEFLYPNHNLLITNCSSDSAAAEYQFFKRTQSGDVEDQDSTGIFRDETTTFPSGEKVSLKVTTSSTCSIRAPLIFDNLSRYATLSTTGTIRVYFAVANTTTLTNANCWAELIYPDGTTKQVFNPLSNRNADILAAGTTHTVDATSTWKDGGANLTGFNEYLMDLDTSGNAGADGVPVVRVYVAEPSVTIYFDPSVDTV